jgi:hypothetical protein
MSPKTL